MKKILLSAFATTLLASTLSANFLSKEEVSKFNDLVLLKNVKAEVLKAYDAGSAYILSVKVQGRTDVISITKDKKYLIAGNLINIDSGEVLTMPIENIAIAKDKESFTFGKGDKEYMVFTDPECPFCKELEKYFPQIEDKVKLKIYQYPVLQLHPNAKELAKFQLSLKDKEKNVLNILSKTTSSPEYAARKYSEKENRELEKKIDEQIKIAETFGVQGTPSVITSDGKIISWVKLLQDNGITPTPPQR